MRIAILGDTGRVLVGGIAASRRSWKQCIDRDVNANVL